MSVVHSKHFSVFDWLKFPGHFLIARQSLEKVYDIRSNDGNNAGYQ